jgi:hypothetical protein
MKLIIKIGGLLLVLQIFAAPITGFCQYFQRLYDIDSSQEWGVDIFLEQSGNYMVFGTQINTVTTDKWKFFNAEITAGGYTVLSKKVLQNDAANFYMGLPGEVKKLNGGYVGPLTIQTVIGGYYRSSAGLIKYDIAGDTTLFKTYTDTSINYEGISSCAIGQNCYFLGGYKSLNTPSVYTGYIIRTDSFGDTIWTHTYQKYIAQKAAVNNIISMPDGRIVIGAISIYSEYVAGFGSINHNTPWFLVLDSGGNILRDTVYGSNLMAGKFGSCGELYPDANGGYILIGAFDSVLTSDATQPQNYPAYIAHLDTNFRINWITEFPYTDEDGHRQGVSVRQLHDGTYLVVGDSWDTTFYDKGFAAKINRTGSIVWSHSYISQPIQNAYLRDAVEKSDGSIVLTGQSSNDTLPVWHQHYDMWLVGVDSNGCEMVNCNITAVPPNPVKANPDFSIFPNPTNGKLSVNTSEKGKFIVCNLLGQKIAEYTIRGTTEDLQLPSWMLSGLYLGRFTSDDGFESREIRFVYQP